MTCPPGREWSMKMERQPTAFMVLVRTKKSTNPLKKLPNNTVPPLSSINLPSVIDNKIVPHIPNCNKIVSPLWKGETKNNTQSASSLIALHISCRSRHFVGVALYTWPHLILQHRVSCVLCKITWTRRPVPITLACLDKLVKTGYNHLYCIDDVIHTPGDPENYLNHEIIYIMQDREHFH